MLADTHAHTHTHTRTRMLADTHAYTHTHTLGSHPLQSARERRGGDVIPPAAARAAQREMQNEELFWVEDSGNILLS